MGVFFSGNRASCSIPIHFVFFPSPLSLSRERGSVSPGYFVAMLLVTFVSPFSFFYFFPLLFFGVGGGAGEGCEERDGDIKRFDLVGITSASHCIALNEWAFWAVGWMILARSTEYCPPRPPFFFSFFFGGVGLRGVLVGLIGVCRLGVVLVRGGRGVVWILWFFGGGRVFTACLPFFFLQRGEEVSGGAG